MRKRRARTDLEYFVRSVRERKKNSARLTSKNADEEREEENVIDYFFTF
jgi:hypothetical protein